jgi:hypothetical protein
MKNVLWFELGIAVLVLAVVVAGSSENARAEPQPPAGVTGADIYGPAYNDGSTCLWNAYPGGQDLYTWYVDEEVVWEGSGDNYDDLMHAVEPGQELRVEITAGQNFWDSGYNNPRTIQSGDACEA